MVKAKKATKSGSVGSGPGNTNQGLRNRSRSYAFTWNNYPADSIERLQQFFTENASKAVVGKEICPTTGLAHLQGYFYGKHQVNFSRLKKFEPTIHWESAKGSPEQNYTYCTKEGDFITMGDWNIPVPIKDPMKDKELRPWQIELEAYLTEEPHDREIVWYYDPVGNTGKSTWAKHWLLNHSDAIMVDGKAEDIKCALALLHKNKKPLPKTILWDIPRSQEHVSYTAMEKIKDGCFFSGKYESGMILMNKPHIIVFSNHLPDYSKLSTDRWNVKILSELLF